MGKYGKKNEISLDVFDYNLAILGEKKLGKTHLVKEALEKELGEDSYIFLELDREEGHRLIEGIIYEEVDEYDELEDIIMDIVENKESDYPNLKVVPFDTIDGLYNIAEKQAIKEHNKDNPSKKVKSIKAAYGGFQGGENRTVAIVDELIWQLISVGVRPLFIGHVKKKTRTDPITGLEYDIVTNNMPEKYYGAILKRIHALGVIYTDREIATKKDKNSFSGKTETKGTVKKESRMIAFRDDSYTIESGTRFENIIDKVEYSVDNYLNALKDALKSSYGKKENALPVEEEIKRQEKKKLKAKQELAKEEKERKEKSSIQDEINDITKKLSDYIKENKVSKPPQFVELLTKMKEKGVLYNSMTTEDIDVAREYLDIIQ